MECRRPAPPDAPVLTRGGIRRIQEEHMLNQDVREGKWKQMRGQMKEWWGKLTDDDLEKVGGQTDRLIGILQEKYGYSKETAQEEFNRHAAELKFHE